MPHTEQFGHLEYLCQYSIEGTEYTCTNYFCEPNCDCGLTFEEAKAEIVSYYEYQLEQAKNITEDDNNEKEI